MENIRFGVEDCEEEAYSTNDLRVFPRFSFPMSLSGWWSCYWKGKRILIGLGNGSRNASYHVVSLVTQLRICSLVSMFTLVEINEETRVNLEMRAEQSVAARCRSLVSLIYFPRAQKASLIIIAVECVFKVRYISVWRVGRRQPLHTSASRSIFSTHKRYFNTLFQFNTDDMILYYKRYVKSRWLST